MRCWSCDRDVESAVTCAHCGALLPPREKEDFFAVLGLPAEFSVDLRAAEDNFRERSRQFHPDKFAKADPRARRASLQRSVQLNEAWRTIRDPVRRAEYLLKLCGYDVGGETGATGPAVAEHDASSTPPSSRRRIPVPTVLLSEILELREALADARSEGDSARILSLAAEVGQKSEHAMALVASEFERARSEPATRGSALESVASALIALRYYQRFLDEVPTDDAEHGPQDLPKNHLEEGVRD
jgi:molecular chaperone HscB